MKHLYEIDPSQIQEMLKTAPVSFSFIHISREGEDDRLEIHAVGLNQIINLKNSISLKPVGINE